MSYLVPVFDWKRQGQSKIAINDRLEALDGQPWLHPGVRYEPQETGVTCGHDDHDYDCLCDVTISGVSEAPVKTGALHELAYEKVTDGCGFETTTQFAEFLETVILYAGALNDYTTSTIAVAPSVRKGKGVPISDLSIRSKLAAFMLEDGRSWPWVRQWLSVNGYEGEARAWYKRLWPELQRKKKADVLG